jgi:hypothetical protein
MTLEVHLPLVAGTQRNTSLLVEETTWMDVMASTTSGVTLS